MDLHEDRGRLLREIEELGKEIEEIKKRIPPYSIKDKVLQLLEQKERKLERGEKNTSN